MITKNNAVVKLDVVDHNGQTHIHIHIYIYICIYSWKTLLHKTKRGCNHRGVAKLHRPSFVVDVDDIVLSLLPSSPLTSPPLSFALLSRSSPQIFRLPLLLGVGKHGEAGSFEYIQDEI